MSLRIAPGTRCAAVALLGFILASGCASAKPEARVETRDFGSGSRLKARVWDVEGALVLRDFFDTERGEACSFIENGSAHIGPGPTRYCLPKGMARHDEGSGPFAVFAERTCKVPLAVAPGDGPAAYVITRPADGCASTPSVNVAGRVETSYPWIFDGEKCRRAPVELTTQRLGEIVPLDAFARAEERIEERGSRIAARVAVAADGARQTFGGFDHDRQEAVRLDTSRAEDPRWVSSRVAFHGAGEVLFGDAACGAPVATKIARDAACPLTAALVFEGECGGGALHTLGPPVERARLHTKDDQGTCTPTLAIGVFAFELGARIETSAFAQAISVDAPGARIRRRGAAGPGGAVVSWAEPFDVMTDAPCVPALAIDGQIRCLPLASASIALFSDNVCIVHAFAESISACDTGPSPRFVRAESDAGARAFEVIAEAPELFTTTSGTCARFDAVVPSRGFSVREIEASRFVVVRERNLE